MRVEDGNASVSFHPLQAASGPAIATSTGEEFSNVWPGVNARYSVRAGRFKEALTLPAPPSTDSFRYAMRLEQLTPRLNDDNSITLRSATGGTGLVIGAPWMRDARGDTSTAFKVSLTAVGNEWLYSVTPDPSWLAAARYPVVIDPWVYSPTGTSVARKAAAYANTEYSPGVNGAGTAAGSYLAVGDPTSDNSDAYPSVLAFDASDLPLDIEMISAKVEVYVDHARNSLPITLDVRSLPSTTHLPGTGDVTWNNIGNDAPPEPAGTYTVTQPNVPGQIYINVTEAIRDWAETRDADPVFLLRDASDTTGIGSGNVLFFSANMDDANEETDLASLRVSFQERGWYTFQGNARHTGRTQYAISPSASLRWSADVGYAYAYGIPDIPPSLIAVPQGYGGNPNLPIVYSVTSDGLNFSQVSRIQDNGDSLQPTMTSWRIVAGVIHGTPLLYNNVLWLTGQDSVGGFMYALNAGDVTQLAWPDDPVTHPNPIRFRRVVNGVTYNSVVYSSPTPNPGSPGGILVAANVEAEDGSGLNLSGFDGYLFCKSASTGLDVWTNPTKLYSLDDEDPYEEGEPHPLPCLFGTPVTDDATAYVATGNGWVNGVRLDNGGPAWSGATNGAVGLTNLTSSDDQVCFVSPLLFQSRLYATYNEDEFVYTEPDDPLPTGYSGIGSLSSLRTPTHPNTYWNLSGSRNASPPIPPVRVTLTTPAARAERHNTPKSPTLIFGDDSGAMIGVGSEVDSIVTQPKVTWANSFGGYAAYQIPVDSNGNSIPIRCSPLISGAPGGTGLVFFGADDGRIRALDADTGAPVAASVWGFLIASKFRSSMAAYKGRLYALSTDGNLWCFH